MHPQQLVQELELAEHSDGDASDMSLMGELEKFFMKDVGQIRALQKERFSGSWIFCKSHLCSSEDTRTFRISESYENVCTVDQLKFELCEDSVGKKAANASDNKTSVFSTPSILHRKAVAGPSV